MHGGEAQRQTGAQTYKADRQSRHHFTGEDHASTALEKPPDMILLVPSPVNRHGNANFTV
jgi:hypothetical protein